MEPSDISFPTIFLLTRQVDTLLQCRVDAVADEAESARNYVKQFGEAGLEFYYTYYDCSSGKNETRYIHFIFSFLYLHIFTLDQCLRLVKLSYFFSGDNGGDGGDGDDDGDGDDGGDDGCPALKVTFALLLMSLLSGRLF